MYAGDCRNCIENVRRELRRIKYSQQIDYTAILRGQQNAYIEIYRHLLCESNQAVTKYLSDKGFDLTGMADRKFMESVYRCIRDILGFKPSITLSQFFSSGFIERKMDLLVSIIQAIHTLKDKLVKPSIQKSAHTQSILEALNNRRMKEKEPEIIEINSVRKEDRSPSNLARKMKHKAKSSRSENQTNKIQILSHVVPERPDMHHTVKRNCQDQNIPLSEIVSVLPSGDNQHEVGTQAHSPSNVKLLENISSKLDNIVARITVLESRMSMIEARLPSQENGASESCLFSSPPTHEFGRFQLNRNHEFNHDDFGNQRRKPVEAVVVNSTSQPVPAVKLIRFSQEESDHALTQNAAPVREDSKLQATKQYSPSLYRHNSDDAVDQKSASSDESDVSSENSDSPELSAKPPRPPHKFRVETSSDIEEVPVKLTLTDAASMNTEDDIKSQMSRIQEMIDSTNVLLNIE